MSVSNKKPPISLQWHMVRGTAFGMLLRWSDKLSGLIGMIVLARLLTPEDYGVVAIASVIVTAVEIFSQSGQYAMLIRHPDPKREHYDTAWTIGVILGLALSAVIVASAPLTVIYFHEPRAQSVVLIFAVRVALNGFLNIGTVDFRRHLNFQMQFWYQLIPPLVAFAVQIAAAFMLRNYWALVIGTIVQCVTALVLSYVLSAYRPSLSLAKFNEIWSFSIWFLLKNFGGVVSSEVDKIAIGGFAGAAAMGRYNVAREVGTMPVQEMTGPMIAALLPVMASARNDREQQRELYLTVLYWSGVIFAVAGIGVALVAEDVTDLLLGSQWHDVKPLIPWFALSFGTVALSSSVYSAFDTLGRPDVSAKLNWLRVVCLSLAIGFAAYVYRDVMAVLIAHFVVAILMTPTMFYALGKALDLPPGRFAATLWRPLAAGLVMAVAVLSLNSALTFTGPARLMLDVSVGGVVFGTSLLLFWFLAGRPKGPEYTIWYSHWVRGFLPWGARA